MPPKSRPTHHGWISQAALTALRNIAPSTFQRRCVWCYTLHVPHLCPIIFLHLLPPPRLQVNDVIAASNLDFHGFEPGTEGVFKLLLNMRRIRRAAFRSPDGFRGHCPGERADTQSFPSDLFRSKECVSGELVYYGVRALRVMITGASARG